MCIQRLQKRYNAWINEHEIHPIWLRLKDSQMQEKYTKELHIYAFKIIKIACVIVWLFSIWTLIRNHDETSEEQIQTFSFLPSSLLSLTIMCLAIKWKLALVDYAMFVLLASRAVNSFVLVYLV